MCRKEGSAGAAAHLLCTVHHVSTRWLSIVAHCIAYLTTFDDDDGLSTTVESNMLADNGAAMVNGSLGSVWMAGQ